MSEIIKEITLGFYNETGIFNVPLSQYDTDRIISIGLTDQGDEYLIPEGSCLRLKASKPDGTQIDTDEHLFIIDNKIKIEIFDQLTSAAGVVKCEIILFSTNNKRITANRFNLLVSDSVHSDSHITSTDDYGNFTENMAELRFVLNTIDQPNGLAQLDENTKLPLDNLYNSSTVGRGIVQLTDSVESNSIDTAATPKSVKKTYDDLLAEIERATQAEETETERATTAEQATNNYIAENKPIWDDKYTKSEVDNKFSTLETNIDWKESVDTFNDIATTYPVPNDGWTVNVKDTNYTYRYDGSEWVVISANAIPNASHEVDGKMSKEDKTKLDGIVVANTTTVGLVKPDNNTVTIEEDGTISAYDTKSVSGSAITLTDSKNAPMLLTDFEFPEGITEYEIAACGKNIAKYPYVSTDNYVKYGVTYQVNPDLSITIGGTHDSSTYASYYGMSPWWGDSNYTRLPVKKGQKLIATCEGLPSTKTFRFAISLYDTYKGNCTSLNNSVKINSSDEILEYNVTEDGYISYGFVQNVAVANEIIEPFTVYPMIRICDENGNPIGDDTYERYKGNTISVCTNTPTPVYGLQSYEDVTNIISSCNTDVTVAYARTDTGKIIMDGTRKATSSVLGNVKVTDSSSVTDSEGLALAATEKNASIDGTLANQIGTLNNSLNLYKDVSIVLGEQTWLKTASGKYATTNVISDIPFAKIISTQIIGYASIRDTDILQLAINNSVGLTIMSNVNAFASTNSKIQARIRYLP